MKGKKIQKHLPCEFHSEVSITAGEQLPTAGAPSLASLSCNNLVK